MPFVYINRRSDRQMRWRSDRQTKERERSGRQTREKEFRQTDIQEIESPYRQIDRQERDQTDKRDHTDR